jgi:tetratricopeptide (TPR) repeat protein
MNSTFLSRFTPSLMPPQTLEALFVQRHALAERTVDLIRESIVTPAKHHTLLIGPRGIGKSHLVSLIFYRITAIEELQQRALIAWLREEEWGVTSFLDLLLRICRALSEQHKDTFPKEGFNELYGSSRGVAERQAVTLLKEFVGNKTLFLIVENLDQLFKGLSSEGQKRLRSFLQENQFCTILATSQSLFSGVSLQTSPFFGFFRIHHLEELTFEEAVTLGKNIASFLKDDALAFFIQTPTGRARIRAVHHLAGGNHRVYVIFSEFLTSKSLDELVNPFMHMLDDLTPYYQARMAWLSPQQKKIVEYLCEQRGAVPVKEIARHCFMSHQTAAGQLKHLREAGYVHSEATGRESFYELREPLMRLCIELKKNRGDPIRLLVDFLRLWHSRTKLEQRLLALQPDESLERKYVSYAIKAYDEGQEDLRVEACLKDVQSCLSKDDYESALHVTEELVALGWQTSDLLQQQGFSLFKLNRVKDALTAFDKALEMNPHNAFAWVSRGIALNTLCEYVAALAAFDKAVELAPKRSLGWMLRGMSLDRLKRGEDALASFDNAVEIDPNYAHAWVHRGIALGVLGRDGEALAALDKAIALDAKDSEAWRSRGTALTRLDRDEEALAAFDKAIESNPKDTDAWFRRGVSVGRLNRHKEALAAFDKAVEIDPNYAHAWIHRGIALGELGRDEEALSDFDKAIELDPSDSEVWRSRGIALTRLDRYDESLTAFNKAIDLDPNDSYVWLYRGTSLDQLHRDEEALVAYNRAIELNPNQGHAWVHRGITCLNLGRDEESLRSFDKAIDLGDTFPNLFVLRAEAFLALNRWEEAVATLNKGVGGFAETGRTSKYNAAKIIKRVFDNNYKQATLRERIDILINLHCKHGAAGNLGEGLVRSMASLNSPMVSSAARRVWCEVWQENASDRPEFQLPLRLLDIGVRFFETHDERLLLELPTEERTLLRPLLGIENAKET